MDNVGLELFIPDKFNLSSNRHTLGHCAFIKSSFLFDKYSNSSQDFDLTSESIKLIDTRKYNENVFHDILVAHRSLSTTSTTTVTMQLEIHLRSTKQLEQYTIVLSHVRVLFIIDWLLKIKDFIESFEQKDGNYIQPQQIQQQIINNKSFEIILNFNQSELVLVQNTSNKNSNAVVLSGTIALVYRESNKFKPLDCSLLGVTLFSCQMNNIESTAVSIIEPINFSFDIHTKEENRQNKNTQTDKMIEKTTLELNLPLLSIRLSYYDIKLMLYMFESITKQIDNARTTSTSKINLSTSTENNYLLTFNNDVILPKDDVFITEYCPQTSYPEFRIRSTTGDLSILNERQKISLTPILSDFQTSTSQTFLNIHLMKFSCDHISLCIIDDCLDADIPLLNIHLNKFKLHITSDGLLTRLYQSDFTFNIDYYNRLLSGWEPFLESWTCQLILKYNILSLTSFLIQSNDVLNINYTKTIHQLYDVVKMNWLNEYNNSTKETFRRPKPYEPYCLTNLCGLKIHFQTWLSSEQRFDTIKYLVENNQIKSFTFPSHLIIKTNNNLTTTTTTTSFSDRRLLIQIEGWEVLKPVSIDRVGTFFRRTISTSSTTNTLNKPILIFIDVKMIDSSTRSITIRSPITIKNKLLTKMDIGIKYGPSLFYEFSLDHNELKSLPLQYCLSMRQIYIRPNGFTLNYCSQPIEWTNIYNDTTKRNNDYDELEEEELNINSSHSQQYSHDAPIPAKRRITSSKDRQSFLRMCNLTSNYKEKDGNIYYFCFKSQRSRLMSYNDERLSAYNLTILSPMIIHNLLPCDLTFHVQNQQLQKVCLKPYKSHHEHMINITKSIDIMFSTDLYRMTRPFQLNDVYPVKYNHSRATFYDTINRPLSIDISVIRSITNQIKILISVPYVLINRSGIPLIFKQESCRDEAAGQSHENELARNREPLLFSFSDVEAAYACVMKVGYGVHSTDDGRPLWSQRFSLERGSNYRELHVQSPHGRPDWIYYIGIDVRQGKGRLRKTNYIFLSTRFMISNQCSYDLSVAQRHLVRGMLQSGHYDPDCCLHVLKHSNVAYHWPRSDLDQLLCIRVINNRQYRHVYWSGGFLIDRVDAFHINMRYDDNQCLILRVQVIQRGGTYFVVFMNSDDMPPPIRIDNLSYVPIQFYQTETKDDLSHLRTFIQPKQTVDYAWDEQTLRPNITCSIVGGTKETYNLMQIGHGEHLCYENHICLALQETFDKEENDCDSDSAFDDDRQHQTETYHHNIPTIEMKSGGVIRNRHTSDSTTTNKKSLIKSKTLDISKSLNIRRNDRNLVIDCIQGRLLLAQREENKRSQLWRMTSNGLLVHDGSSSPRDWTRRETTNDIRQSFVLDVEEVSDSYTSVTHMNGFMRLTIRRYDSKRTLTQTWRFLDGYLCMGQTQMCVQVFGELKENSDLVLGPIVFNNKGLLPPEPNMHIRPQRRLKGSGLLSVRTYADGPTRVLEITNVSNVKQPSLAATTTNKEKIVKKNVNPSSNDYLHRVMHIDFKLEAGIGISIVNSIGRESEELVYILLNDIILEYKDEENEYLFLATIGTVIVSNQLLTATTPCLLYTTYVDESTVQPAVRLQANLQKPNANYKNLHILRYLRIGLNSVTVQIDEILLWKMFEFFGMDFSGSSNNGPKSNDQTINMDDGDYDTQRLLSLLTSTQATRIYFNELMLSSINLDLSVYCGASRSLPANLLSIKRHASFPLVKFENAQIHLKSYEQVHIFNTYDFFILSLTNHYIDELKRQAFKILGSVDFLGNPLGLFNDVTDGFASLVDHGSVTGLVKNVAHGVADSTSKFTGTLSYGLGKLASDDEHDEMREAIQSSYRGSSFSHVIGGTVGLAAGFIGGLTSIITQPYKGVVEDGIGGLMKGVAKGIAGTVSKPVVGVLDFANGLAMAIKESSRSKNVILRNRIRLPRCPANILGLLQAYSIYDANGQSLLYQINRGNLNEKYITRLILSAPPTVTSKRKAPKNSNDDNYTERYGSHVHAMITSERVIIYRTDNEHDESSYEIISDYDFGTLLNVVPVEYNRHPYVQFILGSPHYRSLKQHSLAQQQQASSPTSPPDSSQRPFYKCDTQKIATLLSMNVERARGTYEEEKLTYERKSNDDGNEDDDDEDSN
ncbi:unnamed protein product [Didymodactylos carnosus]|nr:unnamed protein product [Didymodactylos carnosus]CAF3741228.1 unnamed protein product [Didymodactylos carnosus]